MINATKETLNSFYTGNLQYVVPFFQRSYVWDEENWEMLWEHILKISELSRQNIKSEHFIGTLIIKQQETQRIGETKFNLVDGQQRLTTFSILLKAIATSAKGDGDFKKLKDKTNELIVFEDSRSNKFIRIEHSKNDKEYFEKVLLDENLAELKNQDHRILKAYNFFLKKLEAYDDERLDNLKDVILSNVPVISMLLHADDDEQEIFDTINSLGTRLTTGELLKNFIFKEEELRDLYDTHWYQIFEDDDDTINFWSKEKSAGRVKRNNLEMLLYSYLIIKNKGEVKLDELFKEYKKWLTAKSIDEKKAFLEELKGYAVTYRSFPEGTQLNQIGFAENEKRFFHVIENLEITTVYPLVLYIYKNAADQAIKLENLKCLESYLVRRNVCRLTSQNYNNIFIQIIKSLEDSKPLTGNSLENILKTFAEDSNRFPDDSEFEAAFSESNLSNINAREILFCIALYQLNNGYADVNTLSSASYSLEHILPQKWETNWAVAGAGEEFNQARNKKLKTLGNLTLVTRQLNSKMKNAPWADKKDYLKQYSTLKITTNYLDLAEWDESSIDTRAGDLSEAALAIWKKD